MASGKKNYELEIVISGGTDASLGSSIQKARKEIDRLERQAKLSSESLSESFFGMDTKGVDALGKASDRVFGAMLKGGTAAAGGFAAILGASAGVGMGFESQMSTVQAIAQASERDIERLTEKAEEMGRTTQFTAEEAGQGLEYMASAGWSTQQMLDGLPGVMYLAASSGEGLALSADIVTGTLTAFGREAGEAARLADVLAMTSAATNTDVAGLGNAMEYVAPVAGALGYSFEDVSIAVGMMSNANIKGEKAGTALRTMLTNLAKPTAQMQSYMDKLNLSMTDMNGEMIPLRELLTDIRNGFSGLTEAERAEYAAGIAGKEGMSGLLAIVNTAQNDFESLTQEIDNATGAAEEMAQVRINNLAGDIELLKSAAEGTGIEIYAGISEPLREGTQTVTGWLEEFTEDISEEMPTIQRRAKQFGADLQDGFEPIMNVGEWFLENPEVITGSLAGIAAAFGTFKAVQTAKNGITLLRNLSGMIGAWPVAAAGLAIGGIVGIGTAIKTAQKNAAQANLDKHFGNITLSMEDLEETAGLIVKNRNFEKIGETVENLGKTKELASAFGDASKELDRLNWKIGMGFELDEGDMESYAESIDHIVQGAIDIVEQSQYTASLSVQAVFGTGSDSGSQILSGFNEMYASISGEVQELGKQLGDAYSEALEDGIIDLDEARTIQELQQKLAAITEQVSQAQFEARLERIDAQYSGRNLDADTFKNLQQEINETLTERQAALEQSAEALYANLNMQYQRGEISKGEYESRKQETADAFQVQSMTSQAEGLNFSTRSIMDAYEEINQALPQMQIDFAEAVDSSMQTLAMGGPLAFDTSVLWKNLGLNEISADTQDAIEELWAGAQPQFENLNELAIRYREEGKKIPQAILDGLNDAAVIGTITGDADAILYMMAQSISDNPEYTEIVSNAQSKGYEIPDAVAAGITDSQESIRTAVNRLYNDTQNEMDRQFGAGFTVNGAVGINLYAIRDMPRGQEPEQHARGGLISSPTLSWFAENGPEMAIPLNQSARSLGLWKETGRRIGAFDSMYETFTEGTVNNSTSSFSPVFSPVIQVMGGEGAESRLSEGLEAAYEQFVEYMERYKREAYRVAF